MRLRRILFLLVATTAWIIGSEQAFSKIELPVTEHELDNGMKVIALERPNVPVVAFAIYYRVGSIDEQPGKTGIAHYCEHMMFKSTKSLESESFARLMGAVGGGHSNANTSHDRTCYHETVPPDRLELVIRLEAERMANLQPGREEAAKELDVVKEELRLNYMDDPMGRLRFELFQKAFDVHPYKTITIGNFDDVKSITYEDLMSFQRKFYTPSNAFAVVVGNFKTDEMLELMNRFFGQIPPGDPVIRNFPEEPTQTEEKRFMLEMPVRYPIYMAGYKVPAAQNPDNLTLRVLSTILSRGGSSPMGQLAQGIAPVAMQSYCWCDQSLDPRIMMFMGIPLPGIEPEMLEERIQSILDEVIEKGVTQEELDRAKVQILSGEIYSMQSSMGIAMSLGEAEIVESWKDALTLEDQLNEITPAMIQKAAGTYLIPTRRTVGIVKPMMNDDESNPGSGRAQ